MMRESKFRITMGIAVVALLVTAGTAIASHSWGNYHWERAENPITINHGDNVNSTWDLHLTLAAGDWSQSSVLNAAIVAGNTRPRQCRPTAGMVEVCNDSYGNNGWLGIAQIWASGDHITQGVVKVNDFYHDQPPYNTDNWRRLVMCQEIGHTYGLGHQDEDFNNPSLGTCMDYTSDPSGNTSPNQHDFDQLASIYAHLDGSGGGGGGGGGGGCWPPGKCKNGVAAPPGFEMPLPYIEQWGRHVSTSADGGQSMYVKDFGNGYRVITHVTWTLDVAAQRAWR